MKAVVVGFVEVWSEEQKGHVSKYMHKVKKLNKTIKQSEEMQQMYTAPKKIMIILFGCINLRFGLKHLQREFFSFYREHCTFPGTYATEVTFWYI